MNVNALTWAMLQSGVAAPAAKTAGAAGSSFLDAVAENLAVNSADQTAGAQAVTLEERLQARYPGLVYHVFDASSNYWKTRNDYPHYLLYQEGEEAAKTLENWKPAGANPFYGSVDGQFIAPKEIRALSSVPPGSKAVVIHPKVQQRIEEEPAYAEEIYRRIEAWFTFDAARNDAMLPGHSAGMSQSVAIGEDGSIVNAQAHSSGGFSFSRSGSDDEGEDFWEARLKRHQRYMRLMVQAQILHSQGLAGQLSLWRLGQGSTGVDAQPLSGMGMDMLGQFGALQSTQAAIAQTLEMMEDPALRQALGETISGIPIDEVFAATREDIAKFHPQSI